MAIPLCALWGLNLQILFIALTTIIAVCVIVGTCVYIKAYLQHELVSPRSLYYLSAIFFVLIIAGCIFHAIFIAFICRQSTLYSPFYRIFGILYILQSALLLTLLCCRLIFVFQGSVFAISKPTIYIFITFIVGAVATGMAIAVLSPKLGGLNASKQHRLVLVLGSCGFAIYIAMGILLNWLFISKLLKVCQSAMHDGPVAAHEHNLSLLNVATNGVLLCLICTITTICNAYVNLRLGEFNGYSYIAELLFLADMATNALCILLSFKYFNACYLRVCGCCHRRCQSCLTGYVLYRYRHEQRAMEFMESGQSTVSPQSV